MPGYSIACRSFHYDEIQKVCYRKLGFLGFPMYRVGDDGSVWSNWMHGWTRPSGRWRRMKATRASHGYLNLGLTKGKKKVTMWSVHHLVLLCFHGPRPDGMEACHENGKLDNSTENLRWDTHKNNEKDKKPYHTRCAKYKYIKIGFKKAEEIRALYRTGKYQQKDLSEMFGVVKSAICGVVNNKRWVS